MEVKERKFVDAGNIAIVPTRALKKYGLENPKEFRFSIHKIPKGEYVVIINPRVTYQTLQLEEDEYYIGDLCYGIKEWDKFLKDTDYLNKLPGFVQRCDDGVYSVIIKGVKNVNSPKS